MLRPMPPTLRLHLVTATLFALGIGLPVALIVWPRLVIVVALLLVGAAAYGGLYLIVAAYLDPATPPWKRRP